MGGAQATPGREGDNAGEQDLPPKAILPEGEGMDLAGQRRMDNSGKGRMDVSGKGRMDDPSGVHPPSQPADAR